MWRKVQPQDFGILWQHIAFDSHCNGIAVKIFITEGNANMGTLCCTKGFSLGDYDSCFLVYPLPIFHLCKWIYSRLWSLLHVSLFVVIVKQQKAERESHTTSLQVSDLDDASHKLTYPPIQAYIKAVTEKTAPRTPDENKVHVPVIPTASTAVSFFPNFFISTDYMDTVSACFIKPSASEVNNIKGKLSCFFKIFCHRNIVVMACAHI